MEANGRIPVTRPAAKVSQSVTDDVTAVLPLPSGGRGLRQEMRLPVQFFLLLYIFFRVPIPRVPVARHWVT